MSESIGEWIEVSDLEPWKDNPRHNQTAIDEVAKSIKRFGFASPIIARTADKMIIAGHTRFEAAKMLGLKKVPVRFMDLDLNDAQLLALADNKIGEIADWDENKLKDILASLEDQDLSGLGWSDEELEGLLDDQINDYEYNESESGALANRYIEPPFSILDCRQGRWQERKRYWKGLGLDSSKGRKDDLLGTSRLLKKIGGTSIFDPVLCEIMYSWFSRKDSFILDPFAGGSVRGVVASVLERNYVGVDLRAEQVKENREQADVICPGNPPTWICGNSLNIDTLIKDDNFDLVFTCPPYHDLEKYSDDPDDLSNMQYDEFLDKYRKIIHNACSKLNDNRFAGIVVGEIRNKKGLYSNFVADTIQAFLDAGLSYYNEIILVTAVGSLSLRASKIFKASRKIGKTHQNILIFVKGDPKLATEYCGDVEVLEINDVDEV